MKTGKGIAGCLALVLAVSTGYGWPERLATAGINIHGFVEYRGGGRTRQDPLQAQTTLNELRAQAYSVWYGDLLTLELKTDLLLDEQDRSRNRVDLETGEGWVDLRTAYVLFSPLHWMDVKAGRQTLTWGTGDLLFINDLFPKDWRSFFLGRDDEYLKAPSDAVLISLFPEWASIDLVYTPRFDADRYIRGDRISYWNGQELAGRDNPLVTDVPDRWFQDDELALRIYRFIGSYEGALYGYRGFWKSPGGFDPSTGQWLFPALDVFGASVRGPFQNGILSMEGGYYHSRDNSSGDNPWIQNSELRAIIGYEQEAARNVTVGVQYYLEHMLQHDAYETALTAAGADLDTGRDEQRHTLTLRLTWLAMNQNLVLSCFTRYSPSEEDLYIKPTATYKISDRWQAELGGNVFAGRDPHTFLNQFDRNDNVYAAVRANY